jgi:hypothetical protein
VNTFVGSFSAADARNLYLGDFNLRPGYNNELVEPCSQSEAQQQKLFLSPASMLVKTIFHLNRINLELLKSQSTFLLGCDHAESMKTFLKRVIHDDVQDLITGTIKRLPVRTMGH